jgi:hypothetical protein
MKNEVGQNDGNGGYYSGTMAIDGYLPFKHGFLCKNLFSFSLSPA